jgi:hypothetical protein
MNSTAVALVLASTFLHVGWNLLAHYRRSEGPLFMHSVLVIALVGVGPLLLTQIWSRP